MLIQPSSSIMPDRYRTRLKYVETFTTSNITVTPYTYVLRGNSVFDPDHTGTGHQALGHDQLALFYGKYRVNGCKLRLTVSMTTSQTQYAPLAVVVHDSLSTSTALSISSAAERPRARMAITNANGEHQAVITRYMSTLKALGRREHSHDEEANTTQDPAKEWYWHVLIANTDTSDVTSATFTVELTYYVDYFNRIPLVQS